MFVCFFHSLNSNFNYKIEHAIVWFYWFFFQSLSGCENEKKIEILTHLLLCYNFHDHKVTQVQLCIYTCAITIFLGFYFLRDLKTIMQKLHSYWVGNCPSLPMVHIPQTSSFSISSLNTVNFSPSTHSFISYLLSLCWKFSLPSSLLLSPSIS